MRCTTVVLNILCLISGQMALKTENILITVKTAEKYESTRLPIIFDTWFRLARDQIWFITDGGKTKKFKSFQNITSNHMVATNCGGSRRHADLCCKTNVALNRWPQLADKMEDIKWHCLFEDNHYVNVLNLVKELEKYDDNENWYLGRRFYNNSRKQLSMKTNDNSKKWFFATLGSGACLSKALINKMQPYISNNRFVELCQFIGDTDDVTLGFLCDVELGVELTHIPTFHSQYEDLSEMPPELLKKQISLGYYKTRTVRVEGFSTHKDPTRYLVVYSEHLKVLLSSLFFGILFIQINTKI